MADINEILKDFQKASDPNASEQSLNSTAEKTSELVGANVSAEEVKQSAPVVTALAGAADSEPDKKAGVPEDAQPANAFDEKRIKNLMRQGFDRVGAETWVIQEAERKRKLEQETLQEQQQEKLASAENRSIEIQSEMESLQNVISIASQQNRDTSNLTARLQNLQNELNELQPSREVAAESQPDIAEQPEADQIPEEAAPQPTMPDAPGQAQQIEAQAAQLDAEQLAAESEEKRLKNQLESSMKKLTEQDEQLKPINPDRFWNSRSTGQKILAGLGMILGGAPAVNIVNQAIAQDIDAQKTNNQNILARRKKAYELVKLQIDRLSSSTNDRIKKERLQLAKQQMEAEQVAIDQQRIKDLMAQQRQSFVSEKLTDPKGLTRSEVEQLSLQNKDAKIRDRAIFFKDGKARLASTAQSAKDIKQRMTDAESSLESIKKLKDLGEEAFGGALDLVARRQAKTIVQSLVGNLRLELFGPGVMTDTEQKLAREIIGNPTKIFTLSALELASLDTLKKKLLFSTKQRLKKDGIILPESKNEKMVKQLMWFGKTDETGRIKPKAKPNMSEQDAIKVLNRKNAWVDETEL